MASADQIFGPNGGQFEADSSQHRVTLQGVRGGKVRNLHASNAAYISPDGLSITASATAQPGVLTVPAAGEIELPLGCVGFDFKGSGYLHYVGPSH